MNSLECRKNPCSGRKEDGMGGPTVTSWRARTESLMVDDKDVASAPDSPSLSSSARGAPALRADGPPTLPEVGSEFLGFRLIGELGRGAFGRVYLARQAGLASRPVALKVATDLFDESQTLARLQHTNIVPIYSIHRVGPLQAVCMPYFGSTTLRDVYEDLEDRGTLPVSGRGLLTTLYSRRIGPDGHGEP